MDWTGNIGETLKEIRKGKCLSQSKICHEKISRTFLSRIENNLSVPTIVTLDMVLDGLDVSMSEFIYMVNKNNKKEQILKKFWAIADDTETGKLMEVINLCKAYKKNDDLIKDIQCLAGVLLNFPRTPTEPINDHTKNRVAKIWERINQMDLWTLNELKLASYCLFFFPLETSVFIAERIRREMKKYLDYENNQIQIFVVNQYINLCTLFEQEKDFQTAAIYNEHAKNLAKKSSRFDLYFFCLVREGIFTNNKKQVNENLDLLEKIDKTSLVEALKLEVDILSA